MKKLIFSLLLSCCAIAEMQAQTLTFGVKGGLNVAKVSNLGNSGNRASIYAGGFANFAFTDMLSLQPELLYSGQGYYYRDILNNKYTVRLNYLNIPVMFQVRPVPEFYVEAGAQLGLGLSSKMKTRSVTVDLNESKTDVGLGFGFGYQFPMGLGISGRYMFGLTRVIGGDYEDPHRNNVGSVGLFYTFNKKFKL